MGAGAGEIVAKSRGRNRLKFSEGLVPPQVPLMWKRPPPIQNVRQRRAGRKLAGGKFHEGIWVMKQTFLKKWGPQANQRVTVQPSHHVKSHENELQERPEGNR